MHVTQHKSNNISRQCRVDTGWKEGVAIRSKTYSFLPLISGSHFFVKTFLDKKILGKKISLINFGSVDHLSLSLLVCGTVRTFVLGTVRTHCSHSYSLALQRAHTVSPLYVTTCAFKSNLSSESFLSTVNILCEKQTKTYIYLFGLDILS